MARNGCCALWMENPMCFSRAVLWMSAELGGERAQPPGSAPPMDVVQQDLRGEPGWRHGAGVGVAWSHEAMARSVPGSRTQKRLRRGSGSEWRRFPRQGGYCWDSRALRLAFIFSSRFTRWPLLTSSSSVLSSAERSWRKHKNMKLSLSCYPFPKQCKLPTLINLEHQAAENSFSRVKLLCRPHTQVFMHTAKNPGYLQNADKEGQGKNKCGLPSLDLAW